MRKLQPAALAIAAATTAFLGSGAPAARAQGKPAAASAAASPLRTFALDNGLTVVHVERPGLPMVTVQVWYRFGSRHEPAGQRGAARVIEKIMFDGSARVRPEQHRRSIEQVGGQTTSLTTEDVTAYHNTVPVEYLDLALALEADRMRGLLIRQDSVEAAARQVADEARQQESSPLYRVYLGLLGAAFRGGSYSWAPSGARADLEALTAEQVKALYDRHYQPSSALLVVVGGASAEAVDAAVKKRFGPVEGTGAPPPAPPPPGEGAPGRTSMVGSPVGLVMVGYRLPPASHDDIPALQVAGAILSAGTSARLHKQLVARKVVEEVGGQVLVRQGGGLLIAYARFPGDRDAGAVEKALLGEIERLATRGPSAAELRRARAQVVSAGWLGTESATGLANQIGVSWGLTGKPGDFLAELGRIEGVTAAQVKKAAATYLARDKAFVAVAGPTGARKPAGGDK
ncbi:MAG TPA: pitrilysin family protein [Kofleriaceae bacterium]|nr:pitrilysin family protein [Kofleriaceae bacterium]